MRIEPFERFRKRGWFILITLWAVAASGLPRTGHAMCAPFPPEGVFIRSSGQLNWVVMHRDRGEVELIPNAHVIGEPSIFSLVVPTPALPTLAPVPGSLWIEAAALTAPAPRESAGSDGFGCSNEDILASPALPEDGGVIVHEEKTVGAFLATIVSSDDPDALVQWLRDNGFEITPEQENRVEPLTRDGWFFTAMKLDTTRVTPPTEGWDVTVDPVSFTYQADELELPLGFLGINRAETTTMVFHVVDDHRMRLPGFETTYANRVSASEMEAIENAYPSVAGYVASSRFLTKLTRTFRSQDAMVETLVLTQASSDSEFRPTWNSRFLSSVATGLPGHVLALSALAALVGAIASRRK